MGYVEGRKILEKNSLIQYQFHSLHSTKKPGMILKFDMSKAFDKVSWEYIYHLLLAYEFYGMWNASP